MMQASLALIGVVGSLILLHNLRRIIKWKLKKIFVPHDAGNLWSGSSRGLAVLLQWIIVLPLTLAVLILMILTYLLYKKRVIHLSESGEIWVMILTLLAFIASFIYLYRPI